MKYEYMGGPADGGFYEMNPKNFCPKVEVPILAPGQGAYRKAVYDVEQGSNRLIYRQSYDPKAMRGTELP
ncbi:unnamed protein product [marine sediment metagenome]|uniref:Uncharacterized protein n=1 Tax=marine sediment metagenome TaxID=412755 RepID=X0XTY5_9ZZZZ